jgi:hypothetical protein
MTMMMAPSKAVLAGTVDGETHPDGDVSAIAAEPQSQNGTDADSSAVS